MNGGGGSLTNGGGLEALLKAAKFVEEQEKQKKQPIIVNEDSPELEEVSHSWNFINGNHCNTTSGRASPPPPRQGSVIREVHNKLEKNRRAHLKECFELLKKQVPAAPDEKKTSNLSILHSAIRYIQVLKRKEREYEHEMERLAREKIAHQQRLSSLKKELTAQWEHIDFNKLLPESLETEPKRNNVRGLVDSERDIAMIHSDGEDLSNHPVRSGTLYSSTSSLSSASPLQTDIPHTLPHHLQMVNPSGPPSLLVSPIQLLPQTTLRMIPADTQIVHSHLPTSEGNTMLSSGIAHVLNHPLVVPQSSVGGPLLLTTSSQLGGKIMTTPILKTIGQMPLINPHHQYLMKPATMVVVSTSSNVPK